MVRIEKDGKTIVIKEMMTAICTLNELLNGDIEHRCYESMKVMAGDYPCDITYSFRAPKMDEEWYLDVEEDCVVHLDMLVFADEDSHRNYLGLEVPLFIRPEGI
jgi:hypothetical protein